MARARKTQELLDLIRRGAGEDGIYALAAAAGRPYRRVHDQVKRLAAAGLVRLERASVGPRTAIRVRLDPPLTGAPPTFAQLKAYFADLIDRIEQAQAEAYVTKQRNKKKPRRRT